jgi:hypothetical protein
VYVKAQIRIVRSALAALAALVVASLVYAGFLVPLSTWRAAGLPPGFSHVDYEGQYVVEGNETRVIEGRYVLFGEVRVKDNATLLLRNAQVSVFLSGHDPAVPTVADNGRLIVEDSRVLWYTWESAGIGGGVAILIDDNAVVRISNSSLSTGGISVRGHAELTFQDAQVGGVIYSHAAIYLEDSSLEWFEGHEGSHLNAVNSTVGMLTYRSHDPNVTAFIANSRINQLEVTAMAQVVVHDSVVEWLRWTHASLDSVFIRNSTVGLSLDLTGQSLSWSIAPFFAERWNICEDTPLTALHGNLTLEETHVDRIALHLSRSSVFLINSRLLGLSLAGSEGHIVNSALDNFLNLDDSSLYLSDSTVGSLRCRNSNATIVNSILGSADVTTGTMEFWWHLKVVIADQAARPLSNSTVQILNQTGQIVDEKPVNPEGATQFTLLERRIHDNATVSLGKYTVRAHYDDWSAQAELVLDESQTIVLTVTPLHTRVARFLTSPIGAAILAGLLLSALIVAAHTRRRRPRHLEPAPTAPEDIAA